MRRFLPARPRTIGNTPRSREASDVNAQVREAVDRDGYSPFKIGLPLSEIPGTTCADDAHRGRARAVKNYRSRSVNLLPSDSTQILRYPMSQSQHYKFQAEQAKRLARQVTDLEVRERLLQMAGEYSRYAELMEARERPRERAFG
jgi:hypothetical protein